jgi:hypothetical protein
VLTMQFPEILHNHKNVVGRGMVGGRGESESERERRDGSAR